MKAGIHEITQRVFIIYFIIMDYKKLEELFMDGEVTTEAIEWITWELAHNVELKTEDADADLVTIVKTTNIDGVDVIEYVRRSHRKDDDGIDDGVFTYTHIVETPEVVEEEIE